LARRVPETEAEMPYRQPRMDGHRGFKRKERDGEDVQVSSCQSFFSLSYLSAAMTSCFLSSLILI